MAKSSKTSNAPTNTEVEQFEMLYPMLLADLTEIRSLSSKKQDGMLNKLKVNAINKKLTLIKNILKNEPTTEFLEILDDETLPTNSDAVYLMVQFKSAMDQYKSKYYTRDDDNGEYSMDQEWSWKTKG